MKTLQRKFAGLALLALLAGPAAAIAQSYPSKPIRLVVGFAPGGAADLTARAIGDPLGRLLGQGIVIDNRPGAGSSIAAEHVAKAAPDGYTILIASPSSICVNPVLNPKIGYDPQKDFAPVSKITSSPMVVAVNPALPVLDAWSRSSRRRGGDSRAPIERPVGLASALAD